MTKPQPKTGDTWQTIETPGSRPPQPCIIVHVGETRTDVVRPKGYVVYEFPPTNPNDRARWCVMELGEFLDSHRPEPPEIKIGQLWVRKSGNHELHVTVSGLAVWNDVTGAPRPDETLIVLWQLSGPEYNGPDHRVLCCTVHSFTEQFELVTP